MQRRKKKLSRKTRKQESSRNSKKNRQNETTTICPPMQKLTETVNFLRKGRNVADTLWSIHVLYEILYLLRINNVKQPSLTLTSLPFSGSGEQATLSFLI